MLRLDRVRLPPLSGADVCRSEPALSIATEAALEYTRASEQVATRCSGFRSLGHLLARSPVGVGGAVECLQRELDVASTNVKVRSTRGSQH